MSRLFAEMSHFQACKEGDLETVQKIAKVDLNDRNEVISNMYDIVV